MIRAKFESPEKQREFFNRVKIKLGVGARKLSQKLGLKSRGSLESYTLMRTSPPIEIVNKLEKLSGIKADYTKNNGKIYRKKRKFMPYEPDLAIKELKQKFSKDFKDLDKLIKSDLAIKQICHLMRKKGFRFDTYKISKYIGAYRTNLLSPIVKEIRINEGDISLPGFVSRQNKTLGVSFNLKPLHTLSKEKKIFVGIIISENREAIRIFPLDFGRTLSITNGGIRILITEKSGLKVNNPIKIILNTKDFNIDIIESIFDIDARGLAREAMRKGFLLDSQRSTPANHKGDLSLFKNEENIIIEITRAESYKGSYFKIGQCLVQKNSWPESKQFLICKRNFLLPSAVDALKKLNTTIVYTNFENKWEKEVLEQIK